MTKQQKIAIATLEYAIDNKETPVKELKARLENAKAGRANCPPHDPCEEGRIWNEFLCRCDPDL